MNKLSKYLFLINLLCCMKFANAQTVLNTTDNYKSNPIFCAKGKFSNGFKIFLHYQIQNEILIGEIANTHSKNRTPEKIIGTKQNDSIFKVYIFKYNGDVNANFNININESQSKCEILLTSSNKKLNLQYSKIDTNYIPKNIHANMDSIYGNYHYQLGAKGSLGDFYIEKSITNQPAFSIFCLTEDPERNIAEIEKTNIKLNGNSISYKLTNNQMCSIQITFYNGFVYIKYLTNTCNSIFENGATLEGIFLKQ